MGDGKDEKMKESLDNFLQKKSDGGVYVFEMPTGFGKTYMVAKFIYQYLMGEKDDLGIPRIFYLTPQRKNVQSALDEVHNIFKKNGKENEWNKAVKDKILVIQANSTSVIEHLCDEKHDDCFTQTDEYRKLYTKIETLKDQQKYLKEQGSSSDDMLKETEEAIRDRLEPVFRRKVEEIISKWSDCKDANEKIAKIKKNFPWLLEIYPSILSSKRKVFFMTVDKFYHGNNPIISKSYHFLTNEITKNALIYIDESDASKKDLLDKMIQQCTDYRINLLNLINRIYHSTNQDKVPEALFNQLKTEDQNKTTRKSFEKLAKVFKETYEKHNLQYQFKLNGDDDSKKYFLFHDYTTTTVMSEGEKNIYISRDDRNKLNIISTDEKNQSDTLNSLVRSLSGALNYFIGFVTLAAKNFMAYENDIRGTSKEKMQLENAISTVLDIFNLEDTKTLQRIAMSDSRLSRLDVSHNILEYDLYTDGFEYYSFSNDDSHAMTTKLELAFLDNTPEKFLLTLAKKAKIVLLSATAMTKTVTGNFDMQYLEDNLHENFSVPDKATLESLKQEYLKRKNRQDVIDVHDIAILDNEQPASSVFNNPAYIDEFQSMIYPNMLDDDKKSNGEYFEVNRFCKIVSSIRKFLECNTSKSMLLITNRLLKDFGNGLYTIANIKKSISLIAKENNTSDNDIEIVSVSSKDFEKKKEEYNAIINSGKRVIIATSYNTASTGQNLYYTLEGGDEYDIDSIYIEKPTYLLTKVDSGSEITDLTKFIFQIEALQNSGECTLEEGRSYIKTAFRCYGNPKINFGETFNKTYNTDSINNHSIAVIKQAIGRISRNRKKQEQTLVFVDHDILAKTRFDDELDKLQTPEFNAVLEKRNSEIESYDQNLKALTEAANKAKISGKKYRSLLNSQNGEWASNDMAEWENIRDFVLKHPTLSEEEYKTYHNMSYLYFPSIINTKSNSYFYSLKENREEIDKISYLQSAKNNVNIPANSFTVGLNNLMECSYIKNYFERKGYAKAFKENDYMLLPNVLNDIYKGALGEAAGKGLFESKLKINLIPISDSQKFEKFDFQVEADNDIYIDFKNWSENRKFDDEEYMKKTMTKLNEVNGKAAFVINIMAEGQYNIYPFSQANKTIYVIPYLIHKSKNGKWFTDDNKISELKAMIEKEISRNAN